MKKFFIISFVVASFLIGNINAQNLEETLQKITGNASKGYVAPISSSFGANLNTGWITGAPKATIFSFDLEIGFVGMATLFSDKHKSFSSKGNFRFNSSQAEQLIPSNITGDQRTAIKNQIIIRDFSIEISGPTIVGSKMDSIKVIFPGAVIEGQTLAKKQIVLPVTGYLEELPALPMFAPQLTFGTVYGTQLSLRYFPEIEIDKDLGKFKFFGFGIQHNPMMWIPFPLPLNVSVGYFRQNLEVGKIFKASSSIFGLYASKRFGPGALNIEPFAGLSFESSTIDVAYDVAYDFPVIGPRSSTIKYSLDGENNARFTVGANIKLALIGIRFDYNFAKYNSLSGSINIKI